MRNQSLMPSWTKHICTQLFFSPLQDWKRSLMCHLRFWSNYFIINHLKLVYTSFWFIHCYLIVPIMGLWFKYLWGGFGQRILQFFCSISKKISKKTKFGENYCWTLHVVFVVSLEQNTFSQNTHIFCEPCRGPWHCVRILFWLGDLGSCVSQRPPPRVLKTLMYKNCLELKCTTYTETHLHVLVLPGAGIEHVFFKQMCF